MPASIKAGESIIALTNRESGSIRHEFVLLGCHRARAPATSRPTPPLCQPAADSRRVTLAKAAATLGSNHEMADDGGSA
jgi:hypothetical protein